MLRCTPARTLSAKRSAGLRPLARARPSRPRLRSTGNCSAAIRGAGAAAVHAVSGESSAVPFAKLARTAKACRPQPRPSRARGDAQPFQAPPSRRHDSVAPRDAVKTSPAAALAKAAAPVGSVPSGASPSLIVAGEASTLPALSIARTLIAETPAGRRTGEAHALHSAAPPALHSKRAASVAVKAAEPCSVPGAAPTASAIVSGAVRSTFQAKATGVASVWPKRSVDWTRRVWSPAARPL